MPMNRVILSTQNPLSGTWRVSWYGLEKAKRAARAILGHGTNRRRHWLRIGEQVQLFPFLSMVLRRRNAHGPSRQGLARAHEHHHRQIGAAAAT